MGDINAVPDTSRVIDADFIPGGRSVAPGRGWDWIASGFVLFLRQPGVWIAILVMLIVCWGFLNLVPLLGPLISTLLLQIFLGGIMLGCQALDSGGALRFGHLFAGFDRHGPRLAVLGIFAAIGVVVVVTPMILIVGVGSVKAMTAAAAQNDFAALINLVIALSLALTLGLLVALALAVPLYMALWFAPALIVLQDFKPGAALAASFGACLRNFVPFLIYSIAVTVLGVIAAIPAALGFLVLGPVIIASVYTAYRDIFFARS